MCSSCAWGTHGDGRLAGDGVGQQPSGASAGTRPGWTGCGRGVSQGAAGCPSDGSSWGSMAGSPRSRWPWQVCKAAWRWVRAGTGRRPASIRPSRSPQVSVNMGMLRCCVSYHPCFYLFPSLLGITDPRPIRNVGCVLNSLYPGAGLGHRESHPGEGPRNSRYSGLYHEQAQHSPRR
jgi:hypothetical protein